MEVPPTLGTPGQAVGNCRGDGCLHLKLPLHQNPMFLRCVNIVSTNINTIRKYKFKVQWDPSSYFRSAGITPFRTPHQFYRLTQ